jgi:hypothetical protein
MRRHTIAAVAALVLVAGALTPAIGEDSVLETGLLESGSAEAGPVVVGEPLPDLRLPTLDRQGAVRLSSFRGKKVLLIEFASW